MIRRGFIAASLVSGIAVPLARAAGGLQVIYIGGADCPVCQEWKKTQRAAWLSSPQYKQVSYIEVESPSLRDAYLDKYWPKELLAVRDQLPQKRGTPRFLVVRDGKIISNGKWDTVYADIKKQVG